MVTKKTPAIEHFVETIPDCQVTDMGLEGFAECLCKGPNSCEYALPFGYTFLCRHPRLGDMLERARKTKAQATAGQ